MGATMLATNAQHGNDHALPCCDQDLTSTPCPHQQHSQHQPQPIAPSDSGGSMQTAGALAVNACTDAKKCAAPLLQMNNQHSLTALTKWMALPH